MPIGYSGAPRVTQNNMASRLRRLSRSLRTGNSGTPLRLTLVENEEFNMEAAPTAANTNARRPVSSIYSTEFRTADNTSVVNATVTLGYKNDCGFIELRHAADNTLLWGIDNTFSGTPKSVLYLASDGFMRAVNTRLFFDEAEFKVIVNSAATTPTFTIEQDGAGDGFMRWLLTGGQAYSFGIDNSDGDKLKLGTGSVVGGAGTAVTLDSSGNVGVQLETMLSPFDVGKSVGFPITEVNVNTTLDGTHHTVLVNCNSVDRIMSLPAASTATRRVYIIKKIDAAANTVTIDGSGAETIDGAINTVLSSQWDFVRIQCDGTSWFKIGGA